MHKLGIIVPFRDRWDHLDEFRPHITEYLKKKRLNYTVIIVEQDNASAFNRGKLCNVGFLEAKKRGCDYVVFHDVDILPIDVDYTYSNSPTHLISEDIPFKSYFGGVTLFPVDSFDKINGFSNNYWGWGFEDDDLRYRCIKNKLNLSPVEEKYNYPPIDTMLFNGYDSYGTVQNIINTARDFKIEVRLRLGELIFDHEKHTDDFVILNIKGSNFTLKYTSFKRFYLEFFDSKYKMYTLYSEVSDLKNFAIDIEYKVREKSMTLYINNELADSVVLESSIFNYSKSKIINIGSDEFLENKFKGALDRFTIFNRYGEDVTPSIETNNVDVKVMKQTAFNYSFIPYRRKGKIEKLFHPDLGFKDGMWQNSLTRWNQLRFNNEVLLSTNEQEYEGLSNCDYKLHYKEEDRGWIHLKVGI